ncbi:MAG: thioredoxin family protein [Candidatus Bilamarchaeaceae archaeon]
MLGAQLSSQIRKILAKEMGDGEVSLKLFGKKEECAACGEYAEIAKEISSLHDNISFEECSFSSQERARHFIEVAPSLVVLSSKTGGSAAFCGFPGGHLFNVLIDDIIEASKGKLPIPSHIEKKIKSIDFPLKIRVFVSHACPYCPGAVKVAHDFSLLNPKISAQMVDSAAFPELSGRFRVMSVPKTIINDRREFTGAQPSENLLREILALPPSP